MFKYFKSSILILFILFNTNGFGFNSQIEDAIFQSNNKQKEKSYYPSGEVSSISFYKNGKLKKYIDYFHDGRIFQHLNYKNELYHGKYMMWNEDLNILIKGKMKNGKPYSGKFEKYSKENENYEIQIYRKGQIKQ